MRLIVLQVMVVFLLLISGCAERDVVVKDRPVGFVRETEGAGRAVREGDVLTIDYTATLKDGTVILDQEDFRFQTGKGAVILGIEESIKGMKQGGIRIVDIPPHKHWGRKGYGEGPNAVPPNATIRFKISLIDID